MGAQGQASGPDFSAGIPIGDLAEGKTISGRVGDDSVLLSRFGGEFAAVSGTCTHYGGPLGDGLLEGETVRCPWHHACFNLRTGAVLHAPALDPLDRWRVDVEGDTVFVRGKLEAAEKTTRAPPTDVERVVIVGGGAAGLACANELRRLGYAGAITMLSADRDAPVDRPNLSKDYLAGNAPEDWLPLRGEDYYRQVDIDLRLNTSVTAIDPKARKVTLGNGDTLPFDKLLLATGAEPVKLSIPGADQPHVHMVRSVADSRAIIKAAGSAHRAVVIGASFIGLEVAASLRARKIEVHVVAPEERPMQRILGAEMGVACRDLEAIRDLMEKTLECRQPYSKCAEGLMPVWQKIPLPPGTPPA